MLTTTTYELKPLVVAAPAGHETPAGTGVARSRRRAMCAASAIFSRTDDRRTSPAVFGTWNLPRRPVGFVT